MICKFCGFEDTGKYCSNCGKLLSEEVAPITKKNTIKLGFGKSSSANYSYALNLIQQQPTYTTEENGSIHTAVFTEDNIEQFFNIFDYIKNWKSSFVEINGQRVHEQNQCWPILLREKGKKLITPKVLLWRRYRQCNLPYESFGM